ncbi:Crp/Fnr family transcriptional regulator [bacterium]|nr:MAG: Crp/Fnr family transcriptional regulator [bacterium]
MPRDEAHHFQGNQLLAELSTTAIRNLAPHLYPVLFHLGDVLFELGSENDAVYFPKSGMLSMILSSRVGIDVEVGAAGFEGMVGLSDALSCCNNSTRALTQIAGNGWRLSSAVLRDEFSHNSELRQVLLRYQRSVSILACQNILCNRLHSIEQRFAKWLLLTRDRVHGEDLNITHEFLAVMLGARRAPVTLAAQALRQKGLIDYTRGSMTIINRAGLEEVACECYELSKVRTER